MFPARPFLFFSFAFLRMCPRRWQAAARCWRAAFDCKKRGGPARGGVRPANDRLRRAGRFFLFERARTSAPSSWHGILGCFFVVGKTRRHQRAAAVAVARLCGAIIRAARWRAQRSLPPPPPEQWLARRTLTGRCSSRARARARPHDEARSRQRPALPRSRQTRTHDGTSKGTQHHKTAPQPPAATPNSVMSGADRYRSLHRACGSRPRCPPSAPAGRAAGARLDRPAAFRDGAAAGGGGATICRACSLQPPGAPPRQRKRRAP